MIWKINDKWGNYKDWLHNGKMAAMLSNTRILIIIIKPISTTESLNNINANLIIREKLKPQKNKSDFQQ